MKSAPVGSLKHIQNMPRASADVGTTLQMISDDR